MLVYQRVNCQSSFLRREKKHEDSRNHQGSRSDMKASWEHWNISLFFLKNVHLGLLFMLGQTYIISFLRRVSEHSSPDQVLLWFQTKKVSRVNGSIGRNQAKKREKWAGFWFSRMGWNLRYIIICGRIEEMQESSKENNHSMEWTKTVHRKKEKKELKNHITPHLKPSDCYEKKILHWDDERERWRSDGEDGNRRQIGLKVDSSRDR